MRPDLGERAFKLARIGGLIKGAKWAPFGFTPATSFKIVGLSWRVLVRRSVAPRFSGNGRAIHFVLGAAELAIQGQFGLFGQ